MMALQPEAAATTTAAAVDAKAPAAGALARAAVSSSAKPVVRLLAAGDDPAVTRRVLDTMSEASADSPLLPLLGLRPSRHPHYFRLSGLYALVRPQERVLYVAEEGAACALVVDGHALKANRYGLLDLLWGGVLWELVMMPPSSWLPWLKMVEKLDHSGDALLAHGIASGDYLKISGVSTATSARGRGLCSALLDAITARADAEGRACFLEAVPTGVDALYARWGFETMDVMTVELPGGVAEFKLMLRRPQVGSGGGAGGGGVDGTVAGR